MHKFDISFEKNTVCDIYFKGNPVNGQIWISSFPTRCYVGPIDEQIGIQISGPSLMRVSQLFDYDPLPLAAMDHKTFEELRYVDIA